VRELVRRPIPAAEIAKGLRLLQLNIARPQGFLGLAPFRDVPSHRDDMRDTAVRMSTALRWLSIQRTSPLGGQAETPRPGSGRRGRYRRTPS